GLRRLRSAWCSPASLPCCKLRTQASFSCSRPLLRQGFCWARGSASTPSWRSPPWCTRWWRFSDETLFRFQKIADFTQQLNILGRRRRLAGRGGLGRGQTVDLANDQEQSECHDHEVDDGVDEQSVAERDRSRVLCGLQGGIGAGTFQHDEEVGKVHTAERKPQRRIDDVLHQRIDDAGKGRPD